MVIRPRARAMTAQAAANRTTGRRGIDFSSRSGDGCAAASVAVYRRGVSSTEAPSLSQAVKVAGHPGAMEALRERPRRGRGLSLRTLIVLRWLAVVGQTCAILTAYFALHFPLPLWEC